jgi:beta-aspartyl-peptidase (threonine type)
VQAVLLVHGGAGKVPTPERAAARQRGIDAAIAAGAAVLDHGGSALDAVCAAVVVLEDDPHFNAGRGAAATTAGTHELDAAVMVGEHRATGAVAAITVAKNPVLAARLVMETTPHVLLAGAGADALDVEHAPPGWFSVDADPGSSGTVGAVALDGHGHLAAATSTGGRSGQLPGRVGDSPIVGAGTWADDETCAVSGTGAGEAFVRAVFAHSVHVQVAAGRSLAESCEQALSDVARFGGTGGCIAVSRTGEIVMPHTTAAMAVGVHVTPTT